MTTLILRCIKSDFVVTGPDIEQPNSSPAEGRRIGATCNYPGSPIKEIGPIYRPPKPPSDDR